MLPSNRINNEHLKDIYTREEIKQISTTTESNLDILPFKHKNFRFMFKSS